MKPLVSLLQALLIITTIVAAVELEWPVHDIQHAVKGLISRELGNEYISEVNFVTIIHITISHVGLPA